MTPGRAVVGLLLLGALVLSGCASVPEVPGRISRLPGEVVVLPAPAPAEPGLTVEDLVAMARGGAKSEAILNRVNASGARFDLAPGQIIDLHARGLPLAVLQEIHEARERALRNEYAQKLVDLDRKCAEDVQRERRRATTCSDPYGPGRSGVWGGYPPRGGMYWGW